MTKNDKRRFGLISREERKGSRLCSSSSNVLYYFVFLFCIVEWESQVLQKNAQLVPQLAMWRVLTQIVHYGCGIRLFPVVFGVFCLGAHKTSKIVD